MTCKTPKTGTTKKTKKNENEKPLNTQKKVPEEDEADYEDGRE